MIDVDLLGLRRFANCVPLPNVITEDKGTTTGTKEYLVGETGENVFNLD